MKIAIICSSFFPVIDGVTIAVYKRLEQLSILGHQVIVFCPDYKPLKHIYPNYKKYKGKIFPGVEIISLPSSKAIALDFERDVTINSYQIVIKQLAKFKPDIIHVDEAERLGVCLLKLPGVKYARQNNIPCVAWFHTNYIDYFDDYFDSVNQQKFWRLIVIAFISLGIYSCIRNLSLSPFYQKGRNINNPAIAKIINQSNSALVATEYNGTMDAVSLAYSLNSKVKYKIITPEEKLLNQYFNEFDDIYVLKPSPQLKQILENNQTINFKQVYKSHIFSADEFPLDLYSVKLATVSTPNQQDINLQDKKLYSSY